MLEVGKINTLEVVKETEFGVYLAGDENYKEILLPLKYVPKDCAVGDQITVFIYFDSEDRIIATTKTPKAQVGEFALLKAVAVTSFGAFLDWGLEKDLFVALKEQQQRMEKGKSYLVYIYLDEQTNRLAASSRLGVWLNNEPIKYKPYDEVELFICNKSDLGVHTIINDKHWGFLFNEDIFRKLNRGQRIKGYIKQIRPDYKIDVCLEKYGYDKAADLSKTILKKLLENDGFLPVTDKSKPKEIANLFGVSKKTYKKAVGALYKKKIVSLEADGVRLNERKK